MSLAEFKAWLEGYSAAIKDAPTPEQWDTIKAKLEAVAPLSFVTNQLPLFGASPYPVIKPYTTCKQESPAQAFVTGLQAS